MNGIAYLSQPCSAKGYTQTRYYKLPPEEIKSALVLLLQGRSLRAVARYYKIDHKSLRERLLREYGGQYHEALNAKGAQSILASYEHHPNKRLRKAAQEWLEANRDLLIEFDLKSANEPPLLTDRQIYSASLRYSSHYDIRICDSKVFSY